MKNKLVAVGLIFVMCMSLTACKSSDYKEAVRLQEEANYKGALELFCLLEVDYKDVANHVTECEAYITAINHFNDAAEVVNTKNSELDDAVTNASDLISSQDVALDETLRPALETAVSETKTVKYDVPVQPTGLEEIQAITTELNQVDYEEKLEQLDLAYGALEKSMKQYALVNNPKESYVITCLGKVSNIVDMSAATEENDPNGHLNKDGGYTAQVYFSSDLIDQEAIMGSTVIEKGTDCGGSIEVYKTAEEATKRLEYLSAFDGGIFASGSHAVVGTCLVRLSDHLTASQQKEMEQNIINTLIYVE